jgi:formiminotetrahydrofolate cyclodeaminase
MNRRSREVAVSELQIGDFLAALGERTPAPASGAATALTAAFAAALVQLAAGFAHDEATFSRAQALASRLAQLADEDIEAYTAFMKDRNDVARRRIIAVPEAIAAGADEVAELAASVREELSPSVAADADAAAELARAASRVARRLAAVNGAT